MHRRNEILDRSYLTYNAAVIGNENNLKLQNTERLNEKRESNQHLSVTEESNEATNKNKKEKDRLSLFNASVFANILENSQTEMNILAECNTELRITKAISDLPLFFTMKYDLNPLDAKEISRVKNIQNLNRDKLRKYMADRKYFMDTIMDTYMYLNLRNDFTILTDTVNAVLSREQYRNWLYEQEAKNKLLERELHKQLRHQRNHIKAVVYDTNSTIDKLIRKLQDFTLNVAMQFRYIDKWQRARTEQNDQSIYEKESYPSGIIEKYKQTIDQEQRVHSDIILIMNVAIDEKSEKVEEWMNKYEVDIEGIDLKIQYKKNNFQATHERRIALEKRLAKHDELMMDWKHFKEERDKDRKYIADMTKSAKIAQAWWRGILVRQKLGPFEEKKKKKENKKK